MAGIEVIDNGKMPRVVCPHCKAIMAFDVSAFARNGSEIMTDKCKGCKRDLYVCALILVNTSMTALLGNIQGVRDLYAKAGASITDEVIKNVNGGLKQ